MNLTVITRVVSVGGVVVSNYANICFNHKGCMQWMTYKPFITRDNTYRPITNKTAYKVSKLIDLRLY